MNPIPKTAPWMVASLCAAASLFAGNSNSCPKKVEPACQPIEPICQPQICKPARCGRAQEPQTPIIAAYNAPAEINIGLMGDWDFFFSGSFLYWQRTQDDMRLGTKNNLSVANSTNIKGETIDMSFDFEPGFQICLGMNFHNDDWVGYIEYTRVRGESDKKSTTTAPRIFNSWGDINPFFNGAGDPLIVVPGTPGLAFTSVHGEFKCNQDFIDPSMERVYYVGQSLVFHSVFGGRISLISEALEAHYSFSGSSIVPDPASDPDAIHFAIPGTLAAIHRSNNWAIGPRMGLEMDWLLCSGIRFFGSSFVDVLYTHYKVQTKSTFIPRVTVGGTNLVAGTTIFNINRDEFGTVRAHVDLEAGLGWGTYLDYHSWHIDFAASYGFQVFFNENVLRLPSYSPSNLYVQGLTFKARLDY